MRWKPSLARQGIAQECPRGGRSWIRNRNELVRGEPHHPLPIAGLDPVVLPAERDNVGVGADQAAVRDRDAVGIAAEIGEHGLRAAERGLGVGHPVNLAQRSVAEAAGSASPARSPKTWSCPALCRAASPSRNRRRNRRERTRTGRKNPGRQAIHRAPSGGRPPPGTIMWNAGVLGERGPPGVEDRRHADPRAEAPGVRGDGHHRLGRGAEQQVLGRGSGAAMRLARRSAPPEVSPYRGLRK
jgi:hypothetical protein